MTVITVTRELAEQIRSTTGTVGLVDQNGVVLGHLTAQSAPAVHRKSPISLEELEERRKQKGGKPLAEILARLRELP